MPRAAEETLRWCRGDAVADARETISTTERRPPAAGAPRSHPRSPRRPRTRRRSRQCRAGRTSRLRNRCSSQREPHHLRPAQVPSRATAPWCGRHGDDGDPLASSARGDPARTPATARLDERVRRFSIIRHLAAIGSRLSRSTMRQVIFPGAFRRGRIPDAGGRGVPAAAAVGRGDPELAPVPAWRVSLRPVRTGRGSRPWTSPGAQRSTPRHGWFRRWVRARRGDLVGAVATKCFDLVIASRLRPGPPPPARQARATDAGARRARGLDRYRANVVDDPWRPGRSWSPLRGLQQQRVRGAPRPGHGG